MMSDYSTAIVVIQEPGSKVKDFKKFRCINYSRPKKFLKFVREKFPNAHYINFYKKDSKIYQGRIYLKTKPEIEKLKETELLRLEKIA